jgi:hypothetical protein
MPLCGPSPVRRDGGTHPADGAVGGRWRIGADEEGVMYIGGGVLALILIIIILIWLL